MGDSTGDYLHGYPTRERDRFILLMCLAPRSYREWIEEYTSRTVARLCWATSEPAAALRNTTFGLLETISPSGALPNMVNFLRHLPSRVSPWQRAETGRHSVEARLFIANVMFTVQSCVRGLSMPSFMQAFANVARMAKSKMTREWEEQAEALHVIGLMAIAGALTIGSPMQSYFLAMCHYPAWQDMMQAEVDRVLRGRCPDWVDRDKLPLLRAVIQEVIRWRPPVPTGIPHAIESDDVYHGYLIPDGATVHALEW